MLFILNSASLLSLFLTTLSQISTAHLFWEIFLMFCISYHFISTIHFASFLGNILNALRFCLITKYARFSFNILFYTKPNDDPGVRSKHVAQKFEIKYLCLE
jgi:hypothetical protein